MKNESHRKTNGEKDIKFYGKIKKQKRRRTNRKTEKEKDRKRGINREDRQTEKTSFHRILRCSQSSRDKKKMHFSCQKKR